MTKTSAAKVKTQSARKSGAAKSAPAPAVNARAIPFDRVRYAAAKSTRLGKTWLPVDKNVNQLITGAAPVLRTRIRQLVRDFPPFSRAVNILTDWTVGTGLKFQSRVRKPDGKIDQECARYLEDWWASWCDEADIQNLMHFDQMQRLARRQDAEAGEFIFAVSILDRAKTPYIDRKNPMYLKAYEADWLTSYNAQDENGVALTDDNMRLGYTSITEGRRISGGVEYDGLTGAILAYHLLEPGTTGTPLRIPARQIIRGFDVLRPQQLHGVSPLVSSIMLAKDISDFMDTEIDAAQMASKWLGFVTSGDPGAFQAGVTTDTNGVRKLEVENAIIEFLQQGESITFNDPKRPSGMFEPFVKFILRLMAVSSGISYELLSGDYAGLTYSNLKAIRNDIIRGFKPMISRHRFQFCRRVMPWAMDMAVASGQLYLPGYWQNRYNYQRGLWLQPGYESIDPLKDAQADIMLVKENLKSPQEVTAERGRDYEEMIDEIAISEKLKKDKNLSPSPEGKTSALPAQEGKEEDNE